MNTRYASLSCGSTNAFAARLLVVLRKEVWIMISSPSTGRKRIHFPAFPDGHCGACGPDGLLMDFLRDLQLSSQACVIGCARQTAVNVASSGAHYPPPTFKSKGLRAAEHTHVPFTCSSAARHAEHRWRFNYSPQYDCIMCTAIWRASNNKSDVPSVK